MWAQVQVPEFSQKPPLHPSPFHRDVGSSSSLDGGIGEGDTWGRTQSIGGSASKSTKWTMMNIMVCFLHFFIHSIETEACPPNASKHEPRHLSWLVFQYPTHSIPQNTPSPYAGVHQQHVGPHPNDLPLPSLEGCGINNPLHQSINYTHQQLRMPTIAAHPKPWWKLWVNNYNTTSFLWQ